MEQANVTDPSAPMGANAFVARCAADVTPDAWPYWVDACQRALFLGRMIDAVGLRSGAAKVRLAEIEEFIEANGPDTRSADRRKRQESPLRPLRARGSALEASLSQPHRHSMGA